MLQDPEVIVPKDVPAMNNDTYSPLARRIGQEFIARHSSFLALRSIEQRARIDEPAMRALAQAWQDALHAPSDPNVRVLYSGFIDEVGMQYAHLRDSGLAVELTPAQDPYESLAALATDVEDNRRVRVWNGGAIPDDHPLWTRSLSYRGERIRALHGLRAVHEVYGHAVGNNFRTMLGEELAFQSHLRMFSPRAWGTLTVEFRAPLAWLMFGPHVEAGEELTWRDRPYPQQKATALNVTHWGDPLRQ